MAKKKANYWVVPPKGSGRPVSYPTRSRANNVARQVQGAKVTATRGKHGATDGCLVVSVAMVGAVAVAVGAVGWVVVG